MNTDVYDDAYYASHYTQLLQSERYYVLLSKYWRKTIFEANDINPASAVLDYGCGLGQVSAALPNVSYFDHSVTARDFLKTRKLKIIERADQIPEHSFDIILSSHSLEHSPNPSVDLKAFTRYLKPNGKLVLVLPTEVNYQMTLQPDDNQHFFCWTFQTITNLLLHSGFTPVEQKMLYGPFLLGTLGRKLPLDLSVNVAATLGQIRKHYRSMLTIAESPPAAGGAALPNEARP